MRLKVMTYNLLYASHERVGQAMLFQEERAAAAYEVVRGEAPDVLGLTEAVYCGLAGRMLRPDYARLFGMDHLYAAGFEGEWACCLLSRHPIVSAERIDLGRGGGRSDGAERVSGLRAVVAAGGVEVQLDVVHPSPRVSEQERVEALKPALASARRPYVLLGDLNALSDEDPYDRATLVSQLRGHVPDPEALAARMLDRRLVAEVRAHGLSDVVAPEDRGPTLPTRLRRPGAGQGARLRIDYVFASPELRVARAAIVRSDAADRASDHYPVVAELELAP
jgi:endonuclease/exonuclease/phosphatase family metal-dependent hydrolase